MSLRSSSYHAWTLPLICTLGIAGSDFLPAHEGHHATTYQVPGPGKELLVHLCRPEREASDACTTLIGTTAPSANHNRGTLTGREKEVLLLLSEGKSTQDVAADMCISSSTVRNHTQHILHKLNVHSRIAAINLGQKLGLI